MIKRAGYTLTFTDGPIISGYGSVAGKKEAQGPMAKYFDNVYYDTKLGQESWEKAESMLQQQALTHAMERARRRADEIDFIFAGDLLNQCISSAYGLRPFDIPYLGQYGACSTMAQGMIMASIMVESGSANIASCVTSSHFCSAERQYRFPLQYGGQRTPTAQWTVTGSGSCIIEKGNDKPWVKHATVGRIVDLGIKDINNMGAAMAPAAYQTISDFLRDTNTTPDDYDAIITGDLGQVGSKILYDLFSNDGVNIKPKHEDCGLLIFDLVKQDVHSGGSGCGCGASVFCAYFMDMLNKEQLKNVLFIATGALMSPVSNQQGETIPAVAHLINICSI